MFEVYLFLNKFFFRSIVYSKATSSDFSFILEFHLKIQSFSVKFTFLWIHSSKIQVSHLEFFVSLSFVVFSKSLVISDSTANFHVLFSSQLISTVQVDFSIFQEFDKVQVWFLIFSLQLEQDAINTVKISKTIFKIFFINDKIKKIMIWNVFLFHQKSLFL